MRGGFAALTVAAIILALLLAGCNRTGIPECDYTPSKIKGQPLNDCPGVVYFDAKEGKCTTQGAGRGDVCPEGAFKVDESDLLQTCLSAAQGQGDEDYCAFKVAERAVSDAMKLCQEKCEGLK